MKYHLTPKSDNAKTGKIAVSTSSFNTCPDACPLKRNGCYAGHGPLNWHWRHVTRGDRGLEFDTFLDQVRALPAGSMFRHNQAGDLPGFRDTIDSGKTLDLARAADHLTGFTYTHKPMDNPVNAETVKNVNTATNFTINLSADNLREADDLKALNIGPVVTVLPYMENPPKAMLTPAGNVVSICPAQRIEGKTCADCGLCARKDRKAIVGFVAHGVQKGRVGI